VSGRLLFIFTIISSLSDGLWSATKVDDKSEVSSAGREDQTMEAQTIVDWMQGALIGSSMM
jgi:hypothetical protein